MSAFLTSDIENRPVVAGRWGGGRGVKGSIESLGLADSDYYIQDG